MTSVVYYLKPSSSLPRDYEHQVLVTNVLSFLFFFITMGVLGILYSIFGWIAPLPYVLVIALLFAAIPALNRWFSHKIGRVAFCLIPVWLTMFVSIYFKLNSPGETTYVSYFDSRFILIAATILPGIVFRLQERTQLIICLGSITGFIFFYDPIHILFGVGYYDKGFDDPSYQYVNYIVSVTYSVLLFGILLLRSILEKSERDVVAQNHELIEKQNEIEAQHEELQQQQEEMTASSEKLEQANRLIMTQQSELQRYNDTLEALVEQKNADLLATNDELVKYNNELLQFSYTVSHNLRGPVARLLGLTRILKQADNKEKPRLEDLILRSSEELDEILKDLSLIIDIRNDIYCVRERILFEEEWKKAVSMVGDSIKSVYFLDVDFSEAPFMFGVRPMLQSVFYNLLSNAIKYQSPDRKLHITVTSRRNSDTETELIISDNGLGIDLKNQEKNLFKLYKRFHSHVPGKGLGLYLVKTQVETLGGTISVDSDVNRGARFRMVFAMPDQVERQVFFEEDYARLYFDGNYNIIVIKWKRPVESREFRHVFDAVLRSLNVHHSPGWISDVRQQGMLSNEDQQWFVNTVVPQLAACGLKFVAMIGANDESRRGYQELLRQSSQNYGISVNGFASAEEARAWMETILASQSEPIS